MAAEVVSRATGFITYLSTSSLTRRTPRLSGSSGSLGLASGPVAQPAVRAKAVAQAARPARRGIESVRFIFAPPLPAGGSAAAAAAAAAAAIATAGAGAGVSGLVVKKLPDQVLQHHGRLRHGDARTIRQHGGIAARLEADVLFAQQARGQDLGRVSLGNWKRLSSLSRGCGTVGLVVEADVRHAAYHHAGALDRRTHLQAADIVEARLHRIGFWKEKGSCSLPSAPGTAGREAHHHEQPHPEVECVSFHLCLFSSAVCLPGAPMATRPS